MAPATQLWRAAKAASPSDRVHALAVALVLALGTLLRLNGYLLHDISLWLDEALWAPRFLRWPLHSLGIRPLGYVWLTRGLIRAFGATELWLRFLPNLAALLSLPLMLYVAARLLRARWLRVLLLLLFAIHPALVDLANEFKPYSWEVLLHLVALCLYLRFEQTKNIRYLYALLAYLPVAFLCAYNLAFALPGLLLLTLRSALAAPKRRALLTVTLLSGALCAAAAFEVNRLALNEATTTSERTEEYWGKKYDVFFRADAGRGRLSWTLAKTADLAALIGLRRDLWITSGKLSERSADALGAVDRWLWISLSVAGLVALGRGERRRSLLLVAPLVAVAVVNALGKWPLGAFRTNLFLTAYLFPLPFLGIEMLGAWKPRLGSGLVCAVLSTCVVPGFSLGFDWEGHKRTWTRDHYAKEVLERLHERRQAELRSPQRAARVRLVLDLHSSEPHDYYLQIHPVFSARYRQFFAREFLTEDVRSNALVARVQLRLKSSSEVWVVSSKESSTRAILAFAESHARVLWQERVKDQHLILALSSK